MLQLRTPDDAKRLFSALGQAPPSLAEAGVDLSLYDIDERALVERLEPALGEADASALALSVLVAMATAWVAVRAYERSDRSITWALAWGTFGYLLPIPAVAASYYLDVN